MKRKMATLTILYFVLAGVDQAGRRIAFLVREPRCEGASWKDHGGYSGASGGCSFQHV